MPLKLSAPLYETFRLERSDEKYGDGGEPTTVRIKQAAQHEHEQRQQLFSILRREYENKNPDTVTLVQVLSLEELKRLEVKLTLVECNIQDENGKELFKFTKSDRPRIDMTDTQFANAWGTLPPDVANEIHEKVLEVNVQWSGMGEEN